MTDPKPTKPAKKNNQPLPEGTIIEVAGKRAKVNARGLVVVVAKRLFDNYQPGDVCGLTPPAADRELRGGTCELHLNSIVDPEGVEDAEGDRPAADAKPAAKPAAAKPAAAGKADAKPPKGSHP